MAFTTKLTTGVVRLSFCHLDKPRASVTGGVEKYSVTLLIPKTDRHTLDRIQQCMQAARQKSLEKGSSLPEAFKHSLHDGDGLRPSGEPFGAECGGHYVITASSYTRPVLVRTDKTPITDYQEVYSGCYGRAILNFYGYDSGGNKGVTAGLNGIMKISEGEPLSGSAVSDKDWDEGLAEILGSAASLLE